MPKRRIVGVLAGLLVVLALAVGSANAAPPGGSERGVASGALIMWVEPGFSGPFAVVPEAYVPTRCTPVPFGAVGSASNATIGTVVTFFSGSSCAAGDALVTLLPGETNDHFTPPVTHYLGAPAPGP